MEDLPLKALRLAYGVTRTALTDPVITALDRYFCLAKHTAVVTSIGRTPQQQMAIIAYYAANAGLLDPGEHLDLTAMCVFDGKPMFRWQLVWSQLLSRGIIVNPPVAAEVLTDYVVAGTNRKGKTIHPSAHFSGTAFDVGGNSNGCDDEYAIIRRAAQDDIGIAYIRVEHNNNCVHIGVNG